MKISISNIAWDIKYDCEMYEFLKEQNINGLEIAPTRIFCEKPYDKIMEAKKYFSNLKENYSLEISSMQSIWYGVNENIFDDSKREFLISYTKQAIDFAKEIGCNNLVFGCPKNRKIIGKDYYQKAVKFFLDLAKYAEAKNVVIAIEPNPAIYNTDFINTTEEAFELVRVVNSDSFKVNVDFGTIIENKEDVSIIYQNVDLVHHIHISEPFLKKIEKRKEHLEFLNKINSLGYKNYVSVEMGKTEDINEIKETIMYLKGLIYEFTK